MSADKIFPWAAGIIALVIVAAFLGSATYSAAALLVSDGYSISTVVLIVSGVWSIMILFLVVSSGA